jgi:hypothetical protein
MPSASHRASRPRRAAMRMRHSHRKCRLRSQKQRGAPPPRHHLHRTRKARQHRGVSQVRFHPPLLAGFPWALSTREYPFRVKYSHPPPQAGCRWARAQLGCTTVVSDGNNVAVPVAAAAPLSLSAKEIEAEIKRLQFIKTNVSERFHALAARNRHRSNSSHWTRVARTQPSLPGPSALYPCHICLVPVPHLHGDGAQTLLSSHRSPRDAQGGIPRLGSTCMRGRAVPFVSTLCATVRLPRGSVEAWSDWLL